DLERSALRPGNVHSADGWNCVLKPIVARYQGKVSRIYFRADAVRTMDQGRQGRDQVDTAVVQDVRGQRRAAPASCARLQSWQFFPHACNSGADQEKGKLIKIGVKVVSHGRYVVFQMAEVAIPRQMFQEILRSRNYGRSYHPRQHEAF